MELIVNVTKNWGIGFENRLLVSISADLRRFRQLTEGKTVILGRKTLETFPGGRPLKNRRNILLTANPALRVDGADIVHSEEALFARLRTLPRETLCVIGGAVIFQFSIPSRSGKNASASHMVSVFVTRAASQYGRSIR